MVSVWNIGVSLWVQVQISEADLGPNIDAGIRIGIPVEYPTIQPLGWMVEWLIYSILQPNSH